MNAMMPSPRVEIAEAILDGWNTRPLLIEWLGWSRGRVTYYLDLMEREHLIRREAKSYPYRYTLTAERPAPGGSRQTGEGSGHLTRGAPRPASEEAT